MSYDLRTCNIADVRPLFNRYHGYGDAGGTSTYCFAVFEQGVPIAAYVWQPPAFGAAKSVCKEAPYGVLALSRMVAVPRSERQLQRISIPLREQFKLIDRGRWPVLITYSDEGQGHNGWVYRCARMKATKRSRVPFYVDGNGIRRSALNNGKHSTEGLYFGGHTVIQRWEHWACQPGVADCHMWLAGWRREPIPGKVWRSGRQAHRIVPSPEP